MTELMENPDITDQATTITEPSTGIQTELISKDGKQAAEMENTTGPGMITTMVKFICVV